MIYKRILLKLSGESLMGGRAYGIDEVRLGEYAKQIKEIADRGIQIGIVIGGGNIFRGLTGAAKGFDRVKGDQMGMLATVINSLALSSALEAFGVEADVLTAVRMEPVGTYYSPSRAAAVRHPRHHHRRAQHRRRIPHRQRTKNHLRRYGRFSERQHRNPHLARI